jgi:hypothetical protein
MLAGENNGQLLPNGKKTEWEVRKLDGKNDFRHFLVIQRYLSSVGRRSAQIFFFCFS